MDNKLSELSKPVAYSLRFRNMKGEPDKTINANTTFSTLEKAKAYGMGSRYVTQDDGKIVSVRDPSQDPIVEPLYSQEYVSALLAERDAFEASALALRDEWRASKKSNAFLKEQLAKLANFNPDWDMLEACRESWREVAAALKEAEGRLEAKDKRIAELESCSRLEYTRRVERENAELKAKLATPVRLPDVLFIKVSGSAVPVMHAERVKERIQRAGFKVKGDE